MSRQPATGNRPSRRRHPHRISIYEVVGYTSALLLAAAIAFGLFDLMIPWKS